MTVTPGALAAQMECATAGPVTLPLGQMMWLIGFSSLGAVQPAVPHDMRQNYRAWVMRFADTIEREGCPATAKVMRTTLDHPDFHGHVEGL